MEQQQFTEEELANERWLPVPGWPGYDVSDLGRVRSWWSKKGRGLGATRSLGFEPRFIGCGNGSYRKVALYRNGGQEHRHVWVHVLVLETFVGPRPKGAEVCHFPDPNPSNCRLVNLRWDTGRENALDMIRQGRYSRVLLNEADIPVIWHRLVAGETPLAIGKDYGVSGAVIGSIKSRKAWRHITNTLPGQPEFQKRKTASMA